jgi:hypothetical protein
MYVYTDPKEVPSQIRDDAIRHKYSWLIVRDPAHKLKNLFAARVTSEAFLLDRRGVLRYHGRIDDSPFEPEAVHDHSLEKAIASLTADGTVPTQETRVIGCPLR